MMSRSQPEERCGQFVLQTCANALRHVDHNPVKKESILVGTDKREEGMNHVAGARSCGPLNQHQ